MAPWRPLLALAVLAHAPMSLGAGDGGMKRQHEDNAEGAEGCAAAGIDDERLVANTMGTDPGSGHGPLDCHGRGSEVTGPRCSAECEARHLDPLELRRFDPDAGFRYPRRPSLVVTASRDMGRTASTWVYNAVRMLYRQAGEACDSYWLRRLEPRKLARRLETGAHVVVKTHEWTDVMSRKDFEAVQPMLSHVVVSVRQGFEPDPAWMEFATHTIHFEDIVAVDESGNKVGAHGVLRGLAEHLGIAGLSDQDIKKVDYALMTLPMPRSGCDQTTKHWPFHARRGGRPQPKAPPAGDE